MKKRLFALLLVMLTGVHGMSFISGAEPSVRISGDAEELEFDREYWIEKGTSVMFVFKAPAPECYLTGQELYSEGGYLYGTTVNDHTLYSAEGNDLGKINSTNDPEQRGWTEFEVGKTYYLEIKAAETDGTFFRFSPVKNVQLTRTPDTLPEYGEISLNEKEQGVYKYIPGENNTIWDVYTVRETLELIPENEECVSTFFTAPYNIYFDNASMTAGSLTVTYSSVERTCADNWDTLRSYTQKPYTGTDGLADGEMVFAANHYSYVTGSGTGRVPATREYDVYVPAGKKPVVSDKTGGLFRSAEVGDIYSDVKNGDWFGDSALWCAEKKCMTGMSENIFSPHTPLTRAQFVQILAKLDGAELDKYADRQSFSDVPKGQWYSKAVEWAADTGITKGVGEGMFAPQKPVTRQELAVFMRTYALYKGADLTQSADISAYTDAASVAEWAKEAAGWAVGAGLISGTGEGILSPATDSTRAQISLIVKNFSEKILEPMTPSPMNGKYFLEGDNCGYGAIDEIISLSGKEKPNVLYIGMASTDPSHYQGAKTDFGDTRGCAVDWLSLEDLENGKAAEKIEWADIINVGGGDSRMLIARLRKYGTDELIRQAAAGGTVMSGSSAGAICFCNYGASGVGNNKFLNITALGCAKLEICPHGFENERVEKMKEFLTEHTGLVGVSVGGAALEINNGMFRIYSSDDIESVSHRYYGKNGRIVEEDINSMEWRPLSELFAG